MHDMRHKDDYRVALTKAQVRKSTTNNDTGNGGLGVWLSKKKKGPNRNEFQTTYTMNFWCLNPAVTFVELKELLHR